MVAIIIVMKTIEINERKTTMIYIASGEGGIQSQTNQQLIALLTTQ